MDYNQCNFATKAIKAGHSPSSAMGAVSVPIYETSTFSFPGAQQYVDTVTRSLNYERDAFFYCRLGNPTVQALEERMAVLEGAEDAVVTASGMGAVNATLLSLLRAGDHFVVADDMFVETMKSVNQVYPEKGIEADFVDMTDIHAIQRKIRPNTKLIYLELLSNPHLKLLDLTKIADLAHRNNLLLVVDNTFLSPYLLRPLAYGADIVLHSGTKYLCGHGDALLGVVSGKKSLMDNVRKWMILLGSNASPFNAWLGLRGIWTLPLRMKKQSENALEIAEFLEKHEEVEWIRYPGLASHPQHNLAEEYLDGGFGGMVSFRLKGGFDSVLRFADALQMILIATSLGDVVTLLLPVETDPGLIRLSIGCEDVEDLKKDLALGFAALHDQ